MLDQHLAVIILMKKSKFCAVIQCIVRLTTSLPRNSTRLQVHVKLSLLTSMKE